jgi:hypothetical protein
MINDYRKADRAGDNKSMGGIGTRQTNNIPIQNSRITHHVAQMAWGAAA